MSLKRPVLAALLVLGLGCAAPDPVPDPVLRDLPTARPAPAPASEAPVPPAAPPVLPGELGLEEVLDSVRLRYPPLLAALIERDIAAGKMLSAEGAFDLNLAVKSTWYALGYYERNETGAGFEQPTDLWGATLGGGYRRGKGSFPDYYGERETLDGGELWLGARIPLLRNGPIDARRAGVRQAQIDLDLADPAIARARLDFLRAAAFAYWDWVQEGRKLRVAENLVALAVERNAQVVRRVEQGDLPPVDALDSERVVVSRRVAAVAAERRLQRSSITLSLFYRDERDRPILVERSRIPAELPPAGAPELDRTDGDLVRALAARPEMRRFGLQIRRAEVDRDLAKNRMLPSLDVTVAASQDLPGGDPDPDPTKEEFELEAGVSVTLPLQLREARGKLQEAEAGLARLRAQEGFARDRVVAEVRDAASALRAASEQIAQAERNLDLARRVADLERRSFELGKGNLVFVNLREQQAAEAELLRVDALMELMRARAEYRIAIGSP